ncbi:protein phosphatase 2C domain-containing protein [Streptomyces pratensis]|uniref:protein phosphatase 2C domain-containing protein n=1 Tax=Streptomyces pratensis TaxID=1169025 RepID=UPI00193163F2|nr:protein phosphatase 2C domain-containing protein [Streptomyces pratensis]
MARFFGRRQEDEEEPPGSSGPSGAPDRSGAPGLPGQARTPDGRAPADGPYPVRPAPGDGPAPAGPLPPVSRHDAPGGPGPSAGHRAPAEQEQQAPSSPPRRRQARGASVPARETREPRLPGAQTPAWSRFILGRPAARFEPKPPPADPYRPDTLFDGWSTPGLTVRLASVRGDAHRFGGQPRQDDIVVASHGPTGSVVFAVADGVSSAAQSHVGAALACRTAVADVLRQLDEERHQVDWKRVVTAAAYQLLMRVTRGSEPTREQKHEAQVLLATTLVTGFVRLTGSGLLEVNLVHVGDSGAWMLHKNRFHPLLGGKEERADGVFSSAVSALPWLPPQIEGTWYTFPEDGVLLIGTDGFGDPLGDGTGRIGSVMAYELGRPPREPQAVAQLLDFSRETFDDDRTLLAVWPRHRLDESGGPGAAKAWPDGAAG